VSRQLQRLVLILCRTPSSDVHKKAQERSRYVEIVRAELVEKELDAMIAHQAKTGGEG
jgi:hypothetical protein